MNLFAVSCCCAQTHRNPAQPFFKAPLHINSATDFVFLFQMGSVITLKPFYLDRMTDEEFFQFCHANSDLIIERNSNLEIHIMSPTGSESGIISAEVLRQLANWNATHQQGKTFDSSAGFTLPDRSVLSPDASWVTNEQWNAISKEDRKKFAPLCPEFVVEIMSPSDSLSYLKNKMNTWLDNGAHLAWLILPDESTIVVYEKGQSPKTLTGFDQPLSADPYLPGFQLDLTRIKPD